MGDNAGSLGRARHRVSTRQRRLRAAIDELVDRVPESFRPPLDRQRRLLAQSAARHFADPEELALAVAADGSGRGDVADDV